ncbi:LRRC4 [Branchiostoma lanceolatum]|uniref:LRRC4 protein n=1 Tax=Branchiostoma lanceolatum TaxID=7740 RepID=A0A8K0ECL5_BRALA|nr:LRRC4 [Branchiostoma lanceolatum]
MWDNRQCRLNPTSIFNLRHHFLVLPTETSVPCSPSLKDQGRLHPSMSNKARRMLVLLLIVLKETGLTAACSSSRCSSGSGCSSSSCSSHCYCIRKGLTSVPQDLPTTITVLDLDNNAITNLRQSDFSSLERLSLNWNDIRSIEAGMFNDTTQLRSLDLGYNSISTIAADIYDILARIPTVYIGNNIWQCDCRMAPFKQRMNGSYPFENQIICDGPEDSQHIYNVPTDDVDIEYNTIAEINQTESPHHGAGNMHGVDNFGHLVLPPPLPLDNQTGPGQAAAHSELADEAGGTIGGRDTWTDEAEYNDVISPSQRPQPASGQTQHLGSFNNGYEVPSPSLCSENGESQQAREGQKSHQYENSQVIAAAKDAAAGPQVIEYENDEEIESAKQGPKSHNYQNSQVIAAAAKDAAAGPQVIVYQNDDESVDNQSQTAAAPGADSPNHYEPLRNPSSQQQHT